MLSILNLFLQIHVFWYYWYRNSIKANTNQSQNSIKYHTWVERFSHVVLEVPVSPISSSIFMNFMDISKSTIVYYCFKISFNCNLGKAWRNQLLINMELYLIWYFNEQYISSYRMLVQLYWITVITTCLDMGSKCES